MTRIAYWLSLGLIFCIPFQSVVELADGTSTIAQVVGLVVMAFWIVTVLATGRLRKPTAFHAAGFLFVLWHTVSAVWSIDAERTLDRSQTYVQLFALTYLVWDLYRTPAAVRAAFQAYVLGCYVAIFSLYMNYQAGITEASRRYTAGGFNSNALAFGLALGLPLAWYLLVNPAGRERLGRLLRLANAAFLPIAMFAITLTGSRAGFFGALPVAALVAMTFPRLRLRVAIVALVLVLAGGGFVASYAPESSVERLADTGAEIRAGTWNERTAIWRESVRSIASHPILGVGGGTHRSAAIETGKVAHNFALGLLVEVGLLGILLFLGVFAVAAVEVSRLSRWNHWFWLTILGIWLANNATHNWEDSKQTWLFLALAVGAANAARQPEESRRAVVVPIAAPVARTSAYTDS